MINLSEKFVLAVFHQNEKHFSWVRDKESARKTARETGAREDDVHSSKRRLAKEALKKISGAMGDAYDIYFKTTFPTGEKGQRLLPIVLVNDFENKMKELDDGVRSAREEFLQDYPLWIQEARERLQKLFREDDYPPVSEMANRFRISYTILPLPSVMQTSYLPYEIERIVKKYIQEDNEKKWNTMITDIWDRLQTPIAHMVERLGDKDNKFKNSIVTNIKEICETLGVLDINGGAGIEEMRAKIERLFSNINPDDLRDNRKIRNQTLQQAEVVLAEIKERRKIII